MTVKNIVSLILLFCILLKQSERSVSETIKKCPAKNVTVDILRILSKDIPPGLLQGTGKGEAGKIGIVGGSIEYTGAPYFAAMSALKVT